MQERGQFDFMSNLLPSAYRPPYDAYHRPMLGRYHRLSTRVEERITQCKTEHRRLQLMTLNFHCMVMAGIIVLEDRFIPEPTEFALKLRAAIGAPL
jgi:hypothetical protein